MNRNLNNGFRPAFDNLDARQLLAAHLTATLAHGVLTVLGTAKADVIDVQVEHGAVAISGLKKTFAVGRVQTIDVIGGKGNDTINVHTPTVSVQIDGGGGNDTINGVSDAPKLATPAPASTTTRLVVTTSKNQAASQPVATPTQPVVTTTSQNQAPGQSVPTPQTIPTLPVPTASPAPSAPEIAASVQRIIDLANAQRVQAGLAPLAVNSALMQAAQIQSANMAQLNTMSHSLPGTNAPNLTDRAALVGYQYSSLGENIAYNFADADAVVAGWMASPGHRANILNTGYTQIGVAVAYNSDGEPYYTQEFGSPA